MSTTYLVDIDMRMKGLSTIGGELKSLSDHFTGLVDKAGSFVSTMAKVGAASAVAGVTYGVLHLNKELENTKISLGAVFSAQGVSKDLHSGIAMAAGSIERMRKDAAQLPGEFEDLRTILMTIATPALNAGMSREGLHSMAANTMAVAAVMGVQKDMAAREMSQLLEGRAGAHNVLGTRLGFTGDAAQKFNAKSAADRVTALNVELAKYNPAIEEFGHSFEGISSSTVSNIKNLLQKSTSPLFESIKVTLEKVNVWYDQNEGKILDWANFIGMKLNDAFNWGVKKVQEWFPIIREFAESAYFRLVAIWEKIEPYVVRFGNWMKKALEDPNGTLDKIEMILKLYAGVKVAGGIAGAVGSAIEVGSGIKGLLGMGGKAASAVGKGIGVATEASGAYGAVARFGTLANASGGLGGLGGMGVLSGAASEAGGAFGVLAPSVGLMVGAAGGAVVGLTAFAYQLNELADDMTYHKDHFGSRDDADIDAQTRLERGMGAAKEIGERASAYGEADEMLGKLIGSGRDQEAAQLKAAIELYDLADATARVKNGMLDIRHEVSDGTQKALMAAGEHSIIDFRGLFGDPNAGKGKKTPPEHPGGAGVKIGTVEIQVTSNNEPGRVAQLVFDKIANLRRHPRASPDAPALGRGFA